MVELVWAWYFLLWSIGGLHYVAIGPFDNEQVCEQQRQAIVEDVKTRNQIGNCWYGSANGTNG